MVAFVEAVTAWVARRQVTPTTSPSLARGPGRAPARRHRGDGRQGLTSWMARSRVCACRGCERHTGACGWPTTNERRCDRCGRPGFANRFRRTPDHPVRRTSAWRRLAKRTVEAHVARPRLALPGLASRAAPGPTRRARGRPSGAARPRGEGDRWVGRPRPTTGASGGRRIRRTGSGNESVPGRDAGPGTARRRPGDHGWWSSR